MRPRTRPRCVGAIAEWSRRVTSPTEAVDAVHEAFALFRTGARVPCTSRYPLDVLEAPTYPTEPAPYVR